MRLDEAHPEASLPPRAWCNPVSELTGDHLSSLWDAHDRAEKKTQTLKVSREALDALLNDFHKQIPDAGKVEAHQRFAPLSEALVNLRVDATAVKADRSLLVQLLLEHGRLYRGG